MTTIDPRVGVMRANTAPDGLVPIVIGVTGHLDPDPNHQEDLEDAVRAVLREISTTYAERPLLLLTPLARGADTLVARVALEFGAQLVAALPLPRSEYEKDFSGAARDAFRGLIDDPRVIRCVQMPILDDIAGRHDADQRRALQYLLAGVYVARHSDILIALWDGKHTDRVGGTADIVQLRRTGALALPRELLACLAVAPEPFAVHDSVLQPTDSGSVYHIVTPREGQPMPEDAFTFRIAWPQPAPRESHEDVAQIAERIARFNRDAIALRRRTPHVVVRSARQLYDRDSARLTAGLEALRQSFALADTLSIKYQRAWHTGLFILFGLAFVGASAFAFFADGFISGQMSSRLMIGTYVGILAAADAVYLFVSMRRWQDRHQDYRAVAEGLRVQFYWRLAGLEHSASDYYVRKQRDELSWIPHALRACSMPTPPAPSGALAEVHDLWAGGQAVYYDAARARAQRKLRWRHAGSGSFAVSVLLGLWLLRTNAGASPLLVATLIIAILAVLVHATASLLGKLGGETAARDGGARAADIAAGAAGLIAAAGVCWVLLQMPGWLHGRSGWLPTHESEWLLIAIGMTAVSGALLHGYCEIRAFAEHARHYGRLAAVFRRASDHLKSALAEGDEPRARAIMVELGKEALIDHGDWVMLHRERPIELPEAGG